MPNGTIGDHPLTDILFHKVEVYGREADETIRKISELVAAASYKNGGTVRSEFATIT